jgi:uncharacterized membrane protein
MLVSDAVVFGTLALVLGLIFYTRQLNTFKRFYSIVPAVLLCYLLPSLLVSTGVIDTTDSNLYNLASRYLLPAALILMTLSIDLKAILALGPKALILFITATLGIVLGGPLALLLVSLIDPSLLGLEGSQELWRGLATIAGSWIGGGANQATMLEVFGYERSLYGSMVLVDIIVANIWLAILMMSTSKKKEIDRWLKADTKAIDTLQAKVEHYQNEHSRVTSTFDFMGIFAIAFAGVGIAHFLAPRIVNSLLFTFHQLEHPDNVFTSLTSEFLWMVVVATAIGIGASFTKMKKYEGAGASKLGSIFIYILVATIGMQMNLVDALSHPELFAIGLIWISFHALLLIIVAKVIKAPLFFLAVGSQANVGGAASAPIIASEFHPALSSVGILLAVLGYVVGTIGAYLCAILMQAISL